MHRDIATRIDGGTTEHASGSILYAGYLQVFEDARFNISSICSRFPVDQGVHT